MPRQRVVKTYACDFETTVYEGQEYTEVWSAGIAELYTDNVIVLHDIDSMFKFFYSQQCNIVAYFHNLKFDGTFILSYLIEQGFHQAYVTLPEGEDDVKMKWTKSMYNNEFQYMISKKGIWYSIKVKKYNKIIEFRDSLKLFPFKLEEVGKAFNTKHRKLNMEYKGLRYAGCDISEEEMAYIKNDVYVLKEALEYMFNAGHDKLTIGSNCLEEFKTIIGGEEVYKAMYPDLYQFPIDPSEHTYDNAGRWLLKSYRGGWCYLVEEKAGKIFHNGITADVNSLYPSMMHSESGNVFPYGHPTFWTGNYIPPECLRPDKYWFVRIRTRFYLKERYLPFVQIKGSIHYQATKSLRTSDYWSPKYKKYYQYFEDENGNKVPITVTLTLTMTDYILLKEHYILKDTEIIDGCYFEARAGQFDEYIDKYRKIKENSTGALRTLAKLFLNNLYGKFATTIDSSFKVCFPKPDGSLAFTEQEEYEKTPGYIAIGSAITSYARNFTIRAAQMNYYGTDKRGFIYADTDSIHCDLSADEVKGIKVHPTNFCCWKLESTWDEAIFARQKTYIEHITERDQIQVDKPYYNITCAGMPDKCKGLLNESLTEIDKEKEHNQEELEFVSVHRTLSDFTVGLRVPGKLMPKRIRGGTILVDDYYTMR